MKRKWWKIILGILTLVGILLIAAGNILVDVALVPSAMKRTQAFEDITEESVEALVHTDDIQQNSGRAWEAVDRWLEKVKSERLTRRTEDGYELVARMFPNREESHRWVVLLHGYTGWKEAMYPYARRYWKKGYHILAPDMRCHGESEGDFIGMGYMDSRDNRLWISWILEQDPEAEIVLHGQSMGGACALMMAGDPDLPDAVCAAVSDCGYTDAYTMFQKQMKAWFHLPSFPLLNVANTMLRLRGGYDLRDASAIEAVKRSRIPVLIIHGTEDEMISVDMAYELYEAAGCEKRLLIVEGAGHGQAADKDPKRYYETLFSFLEPHIAGSGF